MEPNVFCVALFYTDVWNFSLVLFIFMCAGIVVTVKSRYGILLEELGHMVLHQAACFCIHKVQLQIHLQSHIGVS